MVGLRRFEWSTCMEYAAAFKATLLPGRPRAFAERLESANRTRSAFQSTPCIVQGSPASAFRRTDGHDPPEQLPYAAAIRSVTAALLLGWGVFIRFMPVPGTYRNRIGTLCQACSSRNRGDAIGKEPGGTPAGVSARPSGQLMPLRSAIREVWLLPQRFSGTFSLGDVALHGDKAVRVDRDRVNASLH